MMIKNKDENLNPDTNANASANSNPSISTQTNDNQAVSQPNNTKSNTDTNASQNENANDENAQVTQLDLAVLNEASKIAKMGMKSITYLFSKITDPEMKKQVIAMYSQYGNIQSQINQHFEKYGEIPDPVSLKYKAMSFMGVQFNTMKDKTNSHIAEMLIQGTLMGVITCQKLLNCNLNVQESTTQLLKDFNKFQRSNIDILNAFL